MKMLIIIFALLLSSCAGYVNKLHKDIAKDDFKKQSYSKRKGDRFDFYRNPNGRKRYVPRKGRRRKKISSGSSKNLRPQVKRLYKPAQRKRYTAQDLEDNDNDGSLWSGDGQENFFFSKNKARNIGDLILIKVQKKLKKEMTQELSRAFPSKKKRKKKAAKGAPPATPAPATAKNDSAGKSSKIYDQVSSIIVESINKNHVLLRGKKDVLYKKRKRILEIQALISRRDIGEDDSISSSKFIETNILVLR